MRNLARHIDFLLRDNDCVILPGFGGFIAHSVPAYYVKDEHLYYPPSRNISFNAAITMNDGLLAQSYMKSYGVDYARATYMIDVAIDQLRDVLDEEGEAELPRIGRISQDIYQSLQFTPENAGITSSHHFGLGAFRIQELSQLYQASHETAKQPDTIITHTSKTIDVHINKSMLRQVMYTAAVFLLLLMVSLPIGNDKAADIASLHFADAVPNPVNAPMLAEKAATNPTEQVIADFEDEILPISTNDMTAIPITDSIANTTLSAQDVTEETIAPQPTVAVSTIQVEAPVEERPAIEASVVVEQVSIPTTTESTKYIPTKTYHIIVASLPSHRGADDTLEQYKSKGYPGASLVERDNRVRISLMQFTDKEEANSYLKTLREDDAFKNAWLLAVRNDR